MAPVAAIGIIIVTGRRDAKGCRDRIRASDQVAGKEDVSLSDEDPGREVVQCLHGRAHLFRVLPVWALRGL